MKELKSRFVLDKKRILTALSAAVLIFALTAFTAYGSGAQGNWIALFLLLGVAAGVWVLLDLNFGKIFSVILYLALPFCALYALENYTHVISDLSPMILVLNLLFFYLLYGFAAFLSGSVRRGFQIATLVPMLFGLTNYFVVNFRGSPIVPWDLLSLGTAVSVADNYTFTLSWKAAASVLMFIWMILIVSKSSVTFRNWKIRFAVAAVWLIGLGGYVSGIQKNSVQSFFGMDTTLFTLNVLYRNNGIAAAFLGNLRFLNIEEPSGYSAKRAAEIADEVYAQNSHDSDVRKSEDVSDTDETFSGESDLQTDAESINSEHSPSVNTSDSGTQKNTGTGTAATVTNPNIIVIMDEAFSDLSVWGDFETSEEVMPFFKQLQQEAVGGEVYVSVKGGNTANTEFEFLTGNSMAFLPTGSIPYQQYIKSETPSLASYLKSLGYTTTAIHPYNRSGWDRDTVYEYFGFDQFLDKDSFTDPYRLRGYISDKSAFDKIIEQYEIGKNQGSQFIFEVTMQNHGGYSKETPDFNIYLTLPEVESKTTSVVATEKYLTLINQTDRALQELVEYFEQQSEPTIIVMFGDHQPSDYITNTIQRICGVTGDDTLTSLEQGYRVPFLMWSNYGLEHQYYDGISVNYLSSILMQNANIAKTGYQEFLSNLMQSFPIINANVYQDADGVFHSWDENQEEQLKNYQILQYNQLVDKKHRDWSFFGGNADS